MRAYLTAIALSYVLLQKPLSFPAVKTIKIELVDGKSGKPLSHQRLLFFTGTTVDTVRFQEQGKGELTTGDDGIAALPVDDSVRELNIFVDGFVAVCQTKPTANLRHYNIHDIETSGVTIPNGCGKAKRDAVPGTLILFTRPYSLREKMAT